jgi:2-polyprenyl-6-methoxyphenol hydroxylase-like FAD-dependent oxidoreductase
MHPHHVQVAVYERSPVLQQRGAGLGLDFNGQKALKAINPGELQPQCSACWNMVVPAASVWPTWAAAAPSSRHRLAAMLPSRLPQAACPTGSVCFST